MEEAGVKRGEDRRGATAKRSTPRRSESNGHRRLHKPTSNPGRPRSGRPGFGSVRGVGGGRETLRFQLHKHVKQGPTVVYRRCNTPMLLQVRHSHRPLVLYHPAFPTVIPHFTASYFLTSPTLLHPPIVPVTSPAMQSLQFKTHSPHGAEGASSPLPRSYRHILTVTGTFLQLQAHPAETLLKYRHILGTS